jgi:hypothetical protein
VAHAPDHVHCVHVLHWPVLSQPEPPLELEAAADAVAPVETALAAALDDTALDDTAVDALLETPLAVLPEAAPVASPEPLAGALSPAPSGRPLPAAPAPEAVSPIGGSSSEPVAESLVASSASAVSSPRPRTPRAQAPASPAALALANQKEPRRMACSTLQSPPAHMAFA